MDRELVVPVAEIEEVMRRLVERRQQELREMSHLDRERLWGCGPDRIIRQMFPSVFE